MNELQVLRQEFDIDDAARGIFQIPDVVLALLVGHRPTHFQNVVGDDVDVARTHQHARDQLLDLALEIRRRGNHAGAGQRHVLPGPGLVVLIVGE